MVINVLIKKIVFLLSLAFVLFSCASNPPEGRGVLTGNMPAWVNSVNDVYSGNRYAAAVGLGDSRVKAENSAMSALVAFFGQTVQIERAAASSYRQAVVNGVMESWADTAEMRTNIRSTSSMDNLVGAKIAEVWFDSRGTYYAVAVMEKERGVKIYSELIKANLNVIQILMKMTPNEKNSINGVIRCKFAAVIADVNVYYRNIIVLLDGKAPDGVIGGEYYWLEAQNVIKIIPIAVKVTNDRNGRIYGAFARCFTDLGFEAAVNDSRYIFNINVNLSPVNLPANQNVFTRIELDANLRDAADGLVLLPFNINERVGHLNQTEAEARAFLEAERKINDEFAAKLSDYLSRISARK